jgi:glycosyltransferase involved in cell wall biosynthesis
MKKQFTCLIPFYNEGNRVLSVLKKVSKLEDQTEIICIDDGSSDKSSLKVKKLYPRVKLIRLSINQGKSGAVKAGLKFVKTPNVFLIDADLQGIKISEFSRAMGLFVDNPDLDMIILRRTNDPVINPILAGHILLSGERIIKTKILKDVLAGQVKRFQLEVALNQYCLDNGKQVYSLPSAARNYFKVYKRGNVKGLFGEAEMMWQVLECVGAYNYVRQVITLNDKKNQL